MRYAILYPRLVQNILVLSLYVRSSCSKIYFQLIIGSVKTASRVCQNGDITAVWKDFLFIDRCLQTKIKYREELKQSQINML